ncbi:hypothetical protein Cs7R123_54210 [Catellatospora sp. TT07R-123]|uniref:hypothetical protein n=1 Tax=Catellatospora sp. TT07R-123 TaxID=2733863 RepID=UPI001B24608E|nr:hypothetical protein [Catellatospora sp. TT07R-123]GHJ48079.1 hypothetical protein Cs7R123_54210 [Catellatospora sp. TT07R-123]
MARSAEAARRDLPIYSGTVAGVLLACPAFLWLDSPDAVCAAIGPTWAMAVMFAGFAAAVAALPVGIVLMVAQRHARWLFAPLALLAVAVEAVAAAQLLGDVDCVAGHAPISWVMGLFAMLGGFGLCGLAYAVIRTDPPPQP